MTRKAAIRPWRLPTTPAVPKAPRFTVWAPGVLAEFIVIGDPATKGSWRAVQRGRRTVMISDNPAEAAWHSRAAWAARSAMAGRGAATAPIAVELHFEMRRPHASVYEWPSMGDTDKLARSVLDAMSGIVYVDDRHVVSLVAHKRYATSGPGCRVRVVALTREELNA